MEPSRRQLLIKERGLVKASLTRISTFIKRYEAHEDINNVIVRQRTLPTIWEKYNDIQHELEIHDDDIHLEDHEMDRDSFENQYFEIEAKITTLIGGSLQASPPLSEVASLNNASLHNVASNNIKLPTIQLPSFKGDVSTWIQFYDTFNSLILNNHTLTDVQRHHYLLSCLEGDPKNLIQNLPVSDTNFKIAWELIKNRYSDIKLITLKHVKSLLSLPSIKKGTANEYRNLLNEVRSNINAIEALNTQVPLHELLISQLVLDNVEIDVRKEWELMSSPKDIPPLEHLCTFVENRCRALEIIESNRNIKTHRSSNTSTSTVAKYNTTKHSYLNINTSCLMCKEVHNINNCPEFKRLNLTDRHNFVKQNKLCYNCLSNAHNIAQCKSRNCTHCGWKHHSLLHRTNKYISSNIEKTSNSSATYCSVKFKENKPILLSTAIVQIQDSSGIYHKCRALLDSCSQAHFMTEDLVQRLRLKRIRNDVPIQGISNSSSNSKYSVSAQLKSNVNNYSRNITCSVLTKITADLPSTFINCSKWNIPSDIVLADPTFNQPGKIDILIGAEIYLHLLRPDKKERGDNYPVLQSTELGWILAGRVPSSNLSPSSQTSQHSLLLRNDTTLDQQLQRFWNVETITEVNIKTIEELECEKHFTKNTSRSETGRFIVHLPLRRDRASLGDSIQLATSRFQQLERRLHREPTLRKDYNKFMSEYEHLGHMIKVNPNTSNDKVAYYLPHHAVLKDTSTTTKLRVVFDGSAKTSNGISLNDIMMTGPVVQQDLYSIILRFRTHEIAFSADITKMYRQVNVHSEDISLQRILWRDSPSKPIAHYALTTVTYGTSSAPYLATKCLNKLAEEEQNNYSEAAEVLRDDFYVDDVLSGKEDIDSALKLQSDLIELLAKAEFPLRKWCSNSETLLNAIPTEYRETQVPLQLDGSTGTRTLGLLWHPTSDKFLISTKLTNDIITSSNYSKRNVLSTIASIFDPLGLISPVVISYKIFMQKLWLLNTQWDDNIPSSLLDEWRKLCHQLQYICSIEITRLILVAGKVTDIQIHGFCDASQEAYGACLYVRSVNDQGEINVHLLCSKSRVAPIKQLTLPRLELCGALLLAELIHKTKPILKKSISQVYLWTDSTIVLSWLSSPASKWKTFVANRVGQIQSLTDVTSWNHVKSEDNPADLVSRGTNPSSLQQSSLWWHGPSWLKSKDSFSPSTFSMEDDLPEKRITKCSLIASIDKSDDIILKYSTLTKLVNIVAYCKRFAYNLRNPDVRNIGFLSVVERNSALMICIKTVQSICYKQEINSLHQTGSMSQKSCLKPLHPFLDNNHILRVGGRLQNSMLPYEHKHQIILPPRHHLTKLIIMEEHLRLLHAAPQLLISSLHQRYWIPRCRQVVRSILHNCLPCFKLKSSTAQQLMGTIPSVRVQPARPFINVGVDFAGPLYIKIGGKRSRTKEKAYVAVFICLVTRAIHLELVSDLSTDAFLASLRRFVARRGKCANIYSDNGTNFVGANSQLRQLYDLFHSSYHNERVNDFVTKENCKWHFIPPNSPHFGGMWEAGVKSLKHHLRRTIGTNTLTFEQLTTILYQIEACLNSRPITQLSNDPADTSYLTPGHFLIGQPMTCLPEPNLTNIPINKLSHWQHMQQMVQIIWKRWSSDYLNTLQQRMKWTTSQANIQPGQVVLVKEDNLPPLHWRTAVIETTHPGADGLTRVVTIRTSKGLMKRAIHKLVPLPSASD